MDEIVCKDPDLFDNVSMFLEDSFLDIDIPVVSKTILVKDGDVDLGNLGPTVAPCRQSSDEVVIDSITYRNALLAMRSEDTIRGSLRVEIDSTDSSSISLSSSDIEPSHTALPATLKLLEEVNYRFLGKATPSVPRIVKVEDSKICIAMSPWCELYTKEEEDEDEEVPEEEEEVIPSATNEFLDIFHFAEKFVDNILREAKHECKYKMDMKTSIVTFGEWKLRDIEWPTIEEYTVELGSESIERYIRYSFILTEYWQFRVRHFMTRISDLSDFYMYEAKFCLPTNAYPVAQATVSVYFTIEVSRVIPVDQVVRVTFILEGNRRVMSPGEVEFTDDMLLRVLEMKLNLFQKLDF